MNSAEEILFAAYRILLDMVYGVVRDVNVLGPEERNSDFLLRNLKSRVDSYVILAKSSDDETLKQVAEKIDEKLDALLHENFPIKLKSPLVVPPSSLPSLDDPSESL